MNLKSLLNKSVLELNNSGIPTPELDARILLLCAMKKRDAFVYSHPDYLITNAQYSKFRRFIRRRKTGEPIAYITGHKEFYGYDFFVNKNVLVPRPESEWLVEKGLEFLFQLSVVSNQLSVLDIGTGSGCIIISLAKEYEKQFNNSTIQQFNFYAVDSNKKAIGVAKKNSAIHKTTSNITFLNSNLFSNHRIKNKIFDLIIANLPYVPRTKKVLNSQFSILNSIAFEPQDAIFAKNNGSAIIKKFLIETKSHIKKGSLILLELDPRNAKDIKKFAATLLPTANIELKKDLASLNRYLEIRI